MKRITALLLALLLLTGCSAGKPNYVPTGDALDQGTVATRPKDDDTPVTSEQVLSLAYDPDGSLNPYTDTAASNRVVFSLLYQGLFCVDMYYEVSPVLCRQYSVSKDMKTYTFYLEEATFSDGSVLTAADVVSSLLTAMESPVYSGRFTQVAEVLAVSQDAVRITMKIPYENLPILLDVPIVKGASVHEKWPVGTGPYYQASSFTGPGLVRRTDWWCRAALAATAPGISLVEVDTFATLRDDFEFGSVGLVCADPGQDSYVDFRCDYELWACENGVFLYLACNEKSQTFSDPLLRAALTYAIDRDYLVSELYGGFASAATLPCSPQSPHYSEKLAAQYRYDAEKFRQTVTERSPQQLDITLLVNSADSRRIRVARQIAAMLEVGGFRVTLKSLTGNAYLNALGKGSYDLHLGQTKLSPNMDLSAFFAPKGSLNFGGMSDAAAYSLCQEAMANAGNYYTLHQRVMSDGMLCPILFRSYAIYGQRGLFGALAPARDNVFSYTLGKTMEDALVPEETQ